MTSTTSWADIQRLAADLQRVQLAESNKQRLTESNCVEVISMLISMGFIDLVISSDGKEYVTRKHLQTECANECLAAGGRISLTDLASQLNVNLDHISGAVNQLVRHIDHEDDDVNISTSNDFVICAGELIHRDFINGLCAKLNEQLEELGTISMLQLTRQWELPTELLNQHILTELGTGRISAIRFEDYLCTTRYINTLKGKFRAILIRLTKPCPLTEIYSYLAVSESFFFLLLNELNDQGKLPGKLLGTKNSIKSLYVPFIHERMAKQFILQRLSEEHFLGKVNIFF
uniref:E3 UFM1-protein ligase 1 homolog n=1 Tax=Meloidogyne incognita TaxID=6306 RepID=A0A914LLR3_MELIC